MALYADKTKNGLREDARQSLLDLVVKLMQKIHKVQVFVIVCKVYIYLHTPKYSYLMYVYLH